jgi:hypothetical protein
MMRRAIIYTSATSQLNTIQTYATHSSMQHVRNEEKNTTKQDERFKTGAINIHFPTEKSLNSQVNSRRG